MAQRQKKESYQHWNTPPEVLDPLREFMPINLDPCSNPNSVVRADVAIDAPHADGLVVPWHMYAHTFVNPPYNDQAAWLYKASVERHFHDAEHVTMLIPSSPETSAFREHVFGTADAICFWKRRLRFWRDGKPGTGNTLPSVLVYWGIEPERFAEHFARDGHVCVTEWTGKLR